MPLLRILSAMFVQGEGQLSSARLRDRDDNMVAMAAALDQARLQAELVKEKAMREAARESAQEAVCAPAV